MPLSTLSLWLLISLIGCQLSFASPASYPGSREYSRLEEDDYPSSSLTSSQAIELVGGSEAKTFFDHAINGNSDYRRRMLQNVHGERFRTIFEPNLHLFPNVKELHETFINNPEWGSLSESLENAFENVDTKDEHEIVLLFGVLAQLSNSSKLNSLPTNAEKALVNQANRVIKRYSKRKGDLFRNLCKDIVKVWGDKYQ